MIQVFSSRKNKPKQYGFVDLGASPKNNEISYPTVEFSTSPNGIDWTSCYDVDNLSGVYCYSSPNVPVAKRSDKTKKIGFQDGSRLVSTSYDSRELKFKLIYHGVDETDAMLKFEATQRFLVSREAYWITFADWLGRMYYGTATIGEPEFSVNDWTCEVTFTDLMGLSRSIGTSLSPVEDEWGVNNNVPNNGEYPPYTFKENKFSVYNLSDVYIDPERRGHQLRITLRGSSNGSFQIKNLTTGDFIQRPKAFNGTWVLDGVNPTLNNDGDQLNITGTHGGVITLSLGKNDFQIDNFSGKVSFDFPFWRLS
ncbi:phage tail family protein [Limosilactobacillus portuensis]|uniref:Phage tail family protein n=1 Tax=Limosilactobacillus portuensis TaxID=2742601 RepID=A0ABS6IZC8_9LACO|nr:phage tail domain-containing protein [Limosilactobacillus portuensis]MBU9695999.1 phage tail family protein [Limosilactobacillus portuensis]